MIREYVLATTPEEAVQVVADDPAAVVIGGGTTLMPRVTMGELRGKRAVGLARAGLDYVRRNGATTIGAMTPLQTAAQLQELPALARAAGAIGGWALRTTATVGGNLLVDPPYGDLAPTLLALDAEVRVVGPAGRRATALATALDGGAVAGPGEVLVEIVVPEPSGAVSVQRCARRAASSPPVVAVAARVRREGGIVREARLALGAIGPRAMRVGVAEQRLVGSSGDEAAVDAAVEAAVEAIEPLDDPVASAWYRRRMAALHVRRALDAVLAEEAR